MRDALGPAEETVIDWEGRRRSESHGINHDLRCTQAPPLY